MFVESYLINTNIVLCYYHINGKVTCYLKNVSALTSLLILPYVYLFNFNFCYKVYEQS